MIIAGKGGREYHRQIKGNTYSCFKYMNLSNMIFLNDTHFVVSEVIENWSSVAWSVKNNMLFGLLCCIKFSNGKFSNGAH